MTILGILIIPNTLLNVHIFETPLAYDSGITPTLARRDLVSLRCETKQVLIPNLLYDVGVPSYTTIINGET